MIVKNLPLRFRVVKNHDNQEHKGKVAFIPIGGHYKLIELFDEIRSMDFSTVSTKDRHSSVYVPYDEYDRTKNQLVSTGWELVRS
jgi:hypothetical protein